MIRNGVNVLKSLSDIEIRLLYETAQKEAEDMIHQMEESAKKAHDDDYEQQQQYYQKAKERYKGELERYKRVVEVNNQIEENQERVYQSLLREYEKYEIELSNAEEEYQTQLLNYEQQKKEAEKEGQPFSLAPPKKKVIVPRHKPTRQPKHIPTPPTPPAEPVEKELIVPIKYRGRYSRSAARALDKMRFLTTENRDVVYQILVKEQYILNRIEVAKSELREGESISEGLYCELLTVFELELCKYADKKGIVLHNLEFEVGNRTVQIDAVFITTKGILVFECKNFSGKVSGAEYMKKWVLQTMKKRYDFYNPIMQNQAHIQALQHVFPNTKCYSLVVFSESCILEYIDIHQADTFVFNLQAIKDVITDIFNDDPDVLSDQEILSTANQLQKYCADDPHENPNFKETRSYFSSRSKAKPSQQHYYSELPPFQIEDFIIE